MQNNLLDTSLGERLGTSAAGAAEAIGRCVHCGFCLSTCPTYAESADEAESPRGRIVLMKAVLEGDVSLDRAVPHIDSCLGCLACETSCPSGVEYGALLEPFREFAERERDLDRGRSRMRRLLLASMESPARLLWLSRLGWLGRPFARLLPDALQASLDLLPRAWPRRPKLAATTLADGERRARVVLFPGCVQQVFSADIHAATLEVLAHCGVEVVVPVTTRCCGALAAHVGELDRARALARHNSGVLGGTPGGDSDPAREGETCKGPGFELDGLEFDAILTNVAGCGSGIDEYPRWLAGSDDEEAAARMSARTMDVTTFLDQLGIPQPAELRTPLTAVVQDACHLRHAQGVVGAPRRLLRRIPGLTLVEPQEPEMCCGSAGLFNIEQPEMAQRLGRRKARKLAETGAELVVSGNVGCMLQLDGHLRTHIATQKALHPGREEPHEQAHSDPLLRLDVVSAMQEDTGCRPSSAIKEMAAVQQGVAVRHTMQVLRDAYRGVLG